VTALAICCHPDDMEFMMAGTLLLLKDAGRDIHTINVANGTAGNTEIPPAWLVETRRREAEDSARLLGSTLHPSLVNDMEVFYTPDLIRRLTALVRRVKPHIVFTQSLEDNMEDHMNGARVAVTATFCRNIPFYPSIPEEPAVFEDAMIYHATPHILTDMMRRPIVPEVYADIGAVMDRKEKLLACHANQKEWLHRSQGFDSYLRTMRDLSAKVGQMSGRFPRAEGWRRHSHVGFAREDGNPLADALGDRCITVS
jgi:LmbE family N-acetylglucosaminyl deacetylase